MSLNAKIDLVIQGMYGKVSDLASPNAPFNIPRRISFADGTSAGKADKFFGDTRTILASANDDIDLAGALADEFGAVLTFVKIKAIAVFANPANVNDVKVLPGATNPFNGPFSGTTPAIAVPPGGWALLTAPVNGWPVTAATGDILRISNGGAGTSVVYDIVLIGTSA
jgi:hypothetical protein